MNGPVRLGIALALVYQMILLMAVGWLHRYRINPDGVAYLRIASYYARGQSHLMISGYWGPLLSWLMAPFLGAGLSPMVAARISMGISAVVFVLSCLAVFRCLELSPGWVVVGTWMAAIQSVSWSSEVITPDLLESGLACLGISKLLSRRWVTRKRTQIGAGVFLGAAYLTKAVAFPLTFLMAIGIGLLWVMSRSANARDVGRGLALTFAGFLALAAPWIGVLSGKYGKLTVATAARANHAIVGPPDVERGHPTFTRFHIPEAGRVSSWEDPSNLPYRDWSAFQSRDYARHQIKLICNNLINIFLLLYKFDFFYLGTFSLLFGLLVPPPWRANLRADRWRWSAPPVLAIIASYLPFFAVEQRYYYVVYPFLIGSSVGMMRKVTGLLPRRSDPAWRLAWSAILLVSFALPGISNLRQTFSAGPESGNRPAWMVLGQKLRKIGLRGGVTGSFPESLYVAWFMNLPWYGCEPRADAEDLQRSQATIIIVPRGGTMAKILCRDKSFRDLDQVLSRPYDGRDELPLKAFQSLAVDHRPEGPRRDWTNAEQAGSNGPESFKGSYPLHTDAPESSAKGWKGLSLEVHPSVLSPLSFDEEEIRSNAQAVRSGKVATEQSESHPKQPREQKAPEI